MASKESSNTVDVPAAVQDADATAPALLDHWMLAVQTEQGTEVSKNLSVTLRSLAAVQTELSGKLQKSARSSGGGADAKRNKEAPAAYKEYEAAIRDIQQLTEQWAEASTNAANTLTAAVAPIDGLVSKGQKALERDEKWGSALQKNLEKYHKTISRSGSKCSGIVSTMILSPSQQKTPKAVQLVQRHIRDIDEGNAWLQDFMKERANIRQDMVDTEALRRAQFRSAIAASADAFDALAATFAAAATGLRTRMAAVDDAAVARRFADACADSRSVRPLERPPPFAYALPVPPADLGLDAPKSYDLLRAVTPAASAASAASAAPAPTSTPSTTVAAVQPVAAAPQPQSEARTTDTDAEAAAEKDTGAADADADADADANADADAAVKTEKGDAADAEQDADSNVDVDAYNFKSVVTIH